MSPGSVTMLQSDQLLRSGDAPLVAPATQSVTKL